jgi:hypothetical protein
LGRYGRVAGLVFGTSFLLGGCGLLGSQQGTSVQEETLSINVTSPMLQQGAIAPRYTCLGEGKSPPIFWSGVPAGTKSMALVVDSAAAPITPEVNWIVFDISPDTTDIQAGTLPTGALQARNSNGQARYDPPCPVGGARKYRFTVYALNAVLHQPEGSPEKNAWSAIADHAIAHGRMTVTARPGPIRGS